MALPKDPMWVNSSTTASCLSSVSPSSPCATDCHHKEAISLTCPAKSPQTPMIHRMLNTAEPTMVPTPTSPLVMNTPETQAQTRLVGVVQLQPQENLKDMSYF